MYAWSSVEVGFKQKKTSQWGWLAVLMKAAIKLAGLVHCEIPGLLHQNNQ